MKVYGLHFYKPRYRTYGLGFGGLMIGLIWAIVANIVVNTFVIVWFIIAWLVSALWLLIRIPGALIKDHRARVRTKKLGDAKDEMLNYLNDK